MTEFWESSFIEKQTMWGFEPSDSAVLTKDFFLKRNVKDILVPGIGYALIHLLNNRVRNKFIKDCYNQLTPNGYMIFTTVSKKAPMFRKGKQLNKDYFEIMEGVKMFFMILTP